MILKRKLIVGKYVYKRLIKDFRCHRCLLYLPNNAGCHNISIKVRNYKIQHWNYYVTET